MISPIYRHIEESKCTFGYLFVWRDEFIVFILDIHTVDIANYVLSARLKTNAECCVCF